MDISKNIFDKNKIDDRINSYEIIKKNILDSKFSILDALENLKLVKSRSEAKRLINANGIKINDTTYKDKEFTLSKFINNKEIKISVGKKKIGILKIV